MDIGQADFWLGILAAVLCGGLIGLERQLKGKPSGIRTSIFICLGTNLFIRLGLAHTTPQVDTTRVLGQVITGIGFLGAGVIISRGEFVIGITSASVIWLLAGIGAAIGCSSYGAALVITLCSLFLLVGVGFLETRIGPLQKGVHSPRKR